MAGQGIRMTHDDFMHLGNGELKDYLSLRGLMTSGTKAELVARAIVAAENKLPIKYTEEQQRKLIVDEYQKRLQILNIEDPDLLSDKFVDDVTKWPKLDTGKIFQFILSSKDQEIDYIGKYKTQKAYSYFASNFIGKISLVESNNKLILRGNVTRSFALNESPHKVWVCFEGDSVLGAWCTCIAGTAQCCNHIIALLYKVEYATLMGYNDPACTSVACSWNQGSQRPVIPKKVCEMDLRQDSRIATEMNRNLNTEEKRGYDPRRSDQREVTGDSISKLLGSVQQSMPHAVLFSAVASTTYTRDSPTLPEIGLMTTEGLPDDAAHSTMALHEIFLQNIAQERKLDIVEKTTREQKESQRWLEERKGTLTASNHHEIFTKTNSMLRSTKVTKTAALVSKIMGNSDKITNAAMEWGSQQEEMAKAKFVEIMALKHTSFTVKKVGLVLHPKHRYIGASPDGLCTCRCCPNMVLEIKCPYKVKEANKTLNDGWNLTDFLHKDGEKILLKRSHKYYTQIQAQLASTGCKRAYFFVWVPLGDPLIEVITFDSDLWKKFLTNLTVFFDRTLCCSLSPWIQSLPVLPSM